MPGKTAEIEIDPRFISIWQRAATEIVALPIDEPDPISAMRTATHLLHQLYKLRNKLKKKPPNSGTSREEPNKH